MQVSAIVNRLTASAKPTSQSLPAARPVGGNDASMTAQYVRLVLFVIVVVLAVSILFTINRDDGFESSISDYFHTPARFAFVSSMFAIGVCLMVLYSSVRLENVLLNIAGALAPIVGFAATTQATGKKPPTGFDVITSQVDTFAEQTLPAYFLALVLFAFCVLRVHTENRVRIFLRTFASVCVLAGLTWLCWNEHLGWLLPGRRSVHTLAAIGFFVPLIALVFLTARSSGRKPPERVTGPYKPFYYALSALMFVAGLFLLLDKTVIELEEEHDWPYSVFIVEAVLIACFAAFWLAEFLRVQKLATTCPQQDVRPLTDGAAVEA